ncbi:UbiA prenyltransferase [Apiospora hydei]|uniref:UbiA prenyltransferase n=1 Tax=Apiospora hydei TaxID=1337664 RepID=A0ABR1UVS5_9PEZI
MAQKRAQQGDPVSLYAGGDRPVWVNYVPRVLAPLTRINFAAPVLLVYFPHLYGVLQTAIVRRQNRNHGGVVVDDDGGPVPLRDVLRVGLLLLGGSFFYSMAAHTWDDIVDAPLDRLMARTRNRPIARGAVSVRAALVFTSAQALIAASFFLVLPRAAARCAILSVAACFYYPWAKRHTHLPQLVLGFCLAWGVMTGSASLGSSYGSNHHEGRRSVWEDAARLSLVLACTLWTVIYDTIYAYIDVPEDLRLGLKSTAVLFRHRLKPFLGVMLGGMGLCLAYCGAASGMGLWYFLFAVGGSFVPIGWMIYRVDLSSTISCYRWFSRGFWLPGLAIMVGLGAELLETPG